MLLGGKIPFLVYSGREKGKGNGKVHPCTGTEALYRPYSP
jgi:hypothetical protein